MTTLSSLPTGQHFRYLDSLYIRCQPTAWDALRSNPDHDLFGIDPQIQPRPDCVYVMQVEPDRGVLALMPLDVMVEPIAEPTPASEYAYRVTVAHENGVTNVYGADTLEVVQGLVRVIGLTGWGFLVRVAIEHAGNHINADGSLCREQGRGLQFRSVECRINCGSVVV